MGYCTCYTVSFEPKFDEKVVRHIEKFKKSEDYGKSAFYLAWVNGTDKIKWYDHEDFMRTLSKKFPRTVFTLKGVGEEPNDHWKKYFKDGKMQACRAKITFDPYDEGALE